MPIIFVLLALCFTIIFFSKGVTMGNENFEKQISEKSKEINIKDGLTKEQAIIIAQNELLKSNNRNSYEVTMPIVNYDEKNKTWGIEFKPKNNFKNDIYWGVLINEKTGEVYSGSLKDL